jgi:hypothetical protein
MVLERLTEIEHGAGVRPGERVMVTRLYEVCVWGKIQWENTLYLFD